MKSSVSSLLLIVYLFFVFLSLVGAFFISPYCLFFTAMLIALCINHFLLRKVLSPVFLPPKGQQNNENISKAFPGMSFEEYEKFATFLGKPAIYFCIIGYSIMPVAIAFGFFQISVSQNLPEFYGYSVTSFIVFFSLLSIFIDFVIILLIKVFLLALALLGKVLQFIWEKFFKHT